MSLHHSRCRLGRGQSWGPRWSRMTSRASWWVVRRGPWSPRWPLARPRWSLVFLFWPAACGIYWRYCWWSWWSARSPSCSCCFCWSRSRNPTQAQSFSHGCAPTPPANSTSYAASHKVCFVVHQVFELHFDVPFPSLSWSEAFSSSTFHSPSSSS